MTTPEQSDNWTLTTQALTELSEMSQQGRITISSQEESIWDLTTSNQEEMVQTLPTEKLPNKHGCKVQYRPRWFVSKGAFLVLVWVVLSITASWTSYKLLLAFLEKVTTEQDDNFRPEFFFLLLLPGATIVVTGFLSGWLADTLLGSYKTIKVGVVILFFSMVSLCVLVILIPEVLLREDNLHDNPNSTVTLTAILLAVSSSMGFAGAVPTTINALEFGLGQMPDASNDNITSFIAWFLMYIYIGFWLGDTSITLASCTKHFFYYWEYLVLLMVLCTSIILCSDFLLAPKWLAKQSNSPKSINIIYKVLKYAKQHKYPVQRSSFTYWEEELPSRIDLGKSKYGGPFTLEQVEDVKTVLRMLVVSIPMWIIFITSYILQENPTVLVSSGGNETESKNCTKAENTDCTTVLVRLFTSNANWWLIVGILIHEFVIFPCTLKRPTILKRFGAATFILVLVSSAYLVLNIVNLNYTIEDPMGWAGIVQSITIGLQKMVLITSALEFACAQAPLNTRNLLIAYILCIVHFSYIVSNILVLLFNTACIHIGPYYNVIYYAIATVLSVVGFVLYCILAHWYKRRKRDDDMTSQQWVEEAYDRYLEADVRRR